MEKTYKHFNKEGKSVSVTVPKKPSASRVARAKSAGSFYDKLRKGITGDKTEIVKGAQSIKEAATDSNALKHYKIGAQHGHAAFHAGRKAVPAQDPVAMEYIGKNFKKVGSSSHYLKGWADSWHRENLAHPIKEELTPMQQANHALLSRPKLDPKKYVSAFHPNVEKARKMVADANKPKNEDVYAKVTDPKHDETKKQMSDVKKKISKVKVDKEGHTVGIREAVMNYGAPARDPNAGHADVKKPPGYGSPARGGDGNGLGRSSVSKPPGYGSPAKDLTPGTRVGGRAVKVESEQGKALRTIIGENEKYTSTYLPDGEKPSGKVRGLTRKREKLVLTPSTHRYSKDAVDAAIASSNRAGQKIGGKEAKKIHALLKGWRG